MALWSFGKHPRLRTAWHSLLFKAPTELLVSMIRQISSGRAKNAITACRLPMTDELRRTIGRIEGIKRRPAGIGVSSTTDRPKVSHDARPIVAGPEIQKVQGKEALEGSAVDLAKRFCEEPRLEPSLPSKTALMASAKPFRLSAIAIRTSSTSRLLSSFTTRNQDLAP